MWIFRNKSNKNGEVMSNKERLVCNGYAQEEGVDYGEIFASMAKLEGGINMIAYFTYKNLKVYQMDVKSKF